MTEIINREKLIKYWIDSSDKDYKTMIDLYDTKNYNWSLFMGHLVIEKILKAKYVLEKGEYPPLIHDLRRIIEQVGIEPDKEKIVILDSITRFNINARYDDYKQSFYKLCTEKFATEWLEKIKEMRKWIKKQL